MNVLEKFSTETFEILEIITNALTPGKSLLKNFTKEASLHSVHSYKHDLSISSNHPFNLCVFSMPL